VDFNIEADNFRMVALVQYLEGILKIHSFGKRHLSMAMMRKLRER
jgi:hypothetical protein